MDTDKQKIIGNSEYFSEQKQPTNINKSTKKEIDPFMVMAQSKELNDALHLAKNPNTPTEALDLIIENKEFKNNKEIQDALLIHKNISQKALDMLPKQEIQSRAEAKKLAAEKKHDDEVYQRIKQSERQKKQEEKKIEQENKNNILENAKSGDFSEISIPENLDKMSSSDKQFWKQITRLKKDKENKDEQQKKKDEISAAKRGEVSEENIKRGRAYNNAVEDMKYWTGKADVHSDTRKEMEHLNRLAEEKRKDELKRARKGDFTGIETPGKDEILGKADVKHYKQIEELKKQDQIKRAKKGDFTGTEIPSDTSNMSKQEQKHYAELEKLRKEDEVKRAKRGEVSEENIKRGRAYNNAVEDMKYRTGKADVSSDTRKEMEHLNKLLEGKRKDELKRARKGDFTGIETPGKDEILGKADVKHYKQIEELKKRKEEKDKREQKRKEREEKRQQKDRSSTPKSKQTEGLSDPKQLIYEQLNQNKNKLKNLSRQEAEDQMEIIRASAVSGKEEAIQALADLRTGGGASSSAALKYMSDVQAQINKFAGASTPNEPNAPLQNVASMTQSTSVTKLQPNTHRLNITEDRISEINLEYQQVPEFKRVIG